MDFESLVPVSQDLQFYILEWPLEHTEDGKTEGSFNGDHETWRRFSPVFTPRLSASRSGEGREFRKCRCSGDHLTKFELVL